MFRSFLFVIFLFSNLYANEIDIIQKGNFDRAIEILNKKDDSFDKFRLLAISYAKKKNFEKAEKFYKKALKIKKDIKTVINYSNLYSKRGKFKKSLSILKSITAKNNIHYNINLVKVYAFLGSKERMFDVLKKIDKRALNKDTLIDLLNLSTKINDKNLKANIFEYFIDLKFRENNINHKQIKEIQKFIYNLREF